MVRKRKGGATYFSDIVSSVTSLGIMFIIVLLVSITSFFLESGVRGSLYTGVLYKDPMTEKIMMNYMDYTENGINMGELVTLAVYNGNTTFDYGGKEIDLGELSSRVLNSLTIVKGKLILEIDGKEFVLVNQKGDFTNRATILIKAGAKDAKLIYER